MTERKHPTFIRLRTIDPTKKIASLNFNDNLCVLDVGVFLCSYAGTQPYENNRIHYLALGFSFVKFSYSCVETIFDSVMLTELMSGS